ncbi:MAG: family 10 glycosylhydrolase [Elusimicrobia bacterium]|nr:family 10 glycosylhydrolase [Elusimicrobiota bacterium]
MTRARVLAVAAALAACGPRMARPPELPPLPAPTDSGLAAVPVPPAPPSTWIEKHEMRAGWVVAWRQMTSTAAIDQAMSWSESAGLNTLFVQVRASGDAYYRSALAPRAEALAGQPEDFDPLAYALEKGRAKGFKIHAWLNTGIIWRSTTPPVAADHVFNAHPEWILKDATGKLAWPDPATDPKPGYVEEHYWVNWGHPDLQRHLIDVAREVAERYDVDGVHLDFVRFPARMGPRTPGVGYDEVSVARFKEATGGLEPREHDRAWDEWRADQITEVVKGAYWAVKGLRPRVDVSAAALGAWNLAAGRAFTSYRRWLHDGILDFAVPMSYFKDPSWIWQSALAASELSDPRRVVLGLFLPYHTPAALAEQIRLGRDMGLRGWSLFSLDAVDVPGIDAYAPEVRRVAYTDPADDRFASREPLWNRVGVLDERRKSWTLRFYSRTGNSKLVVYPSGVTKFRAKINGRPLPELPVREAVVQADVTAYLEPSNREVAAHHDFTLSVEADGGPGFYAQVFVVDYYARPATLVAPPPPETTDAPTPAAARP